jgi:hypothetical protein
MTDIIQRRMNKMMNDLAQIKELCKEFIQNGGDMAPIIQDCITKLAVEIHKRYPQADPKACGLVAKYIGFSILNDIRNA